MSNQLRAIITGITGQTGSYLAELLLSKGYEVHGVVRNLSSCDSSKLDNIKHITNFVSLHDADLLDYPSLNSLIYTVNPHEFYNLAAFSSVVDSWNVPTMVSNVNAMAVVNILEIVKHKRFKFFQASSSEIFRGCDADIQNELTPLVPMNPYGCSKAYAHNMVKSYRQKFGLQVCSGVLYNHESPRRGSNFFTKKVAIGVAKIKRGLQDTLELGDLSTVKDISHAKDVAEAIWLMVFNGCSKDYVVSSGVSATVRNFVEKCFAYVGLDINNHVVIKRDDRRDPELHSLIGDSSLIKMELGWRNRHCLSDIVKDMMDHELNSGC